MFGIHMYPPLSDTPSTLQLRLRRAVNRADHGSRGNDGTWHQPCASHLWSLEIKNSPGNSRGFPTLQAAHDIHDAIFFPHLWGKPWKIVSRKVKLDQTSLRISCFSTLLRRVERENIHLPSANFRISSSLPRPAGDPHGSLNWMQGGPPNDRQVDARSFTSVHVWVRDN